MCLIQQKSDETRHRMICIPRLTIERHQQSHDRTPERDIFVSVLEPICFRFSQDNNRLSRICMYVHGSQTASRSLSLLHVCTWVIIHASYDYICPLENHIFHKTPQPWSTFDRGFCTKSRSTAAGGIKTWLVPELDQSRVRIRNQTLRPRGNIYLASQLPM